MDNMGLLGWNCLILAIFCAGALSQNNADELRNIFTICSKENGLNDEQMEKLRLAKLDDADVVDEMKCTVKCYMIKAGFMNDAGKFNAAAFKEGMPSPDKNVLNEATYKCKTVEGPNPCETAFLIATCMIHNGLRMSE